MFDNKGNSWEESNYDGYGEFGGKDFYELLSEMNGQGSDRDIGIDLFFEGNKGIPMPRFVRAENSCRDYDQYDNPSDCELQGFFYDNQDEHNFF